MKYLDKKTYQEGGLTDPPAGLSIGKRGSMNYIDVRYPGIEGSIQRDMPTVRLKKLVIRNEDGTIDRQRTRGAVASQFLKRPGSGDYPTGVVYTDEHVDMLVDDLLASPFVTRMKESTQQKQVDMLAESFAAAKPEDRGEILIKQLDEVGIRLPSENSLDKMIEKGEINPFYLGQIRGKLRRGAFEGERETVKEQLGESPADTFSE